MAVVLAAYHFARVREVCDVEAQPPASVLVPIELPSFSEGDLLADREIVPEGEVPTAYGGAVVARVDTGNRGHGGQNLGKRAENLAVLDEDLALNPNLMNHLDRDQEQRLRTARWRATHEDRRATTNPMELSFLATGTGKLDERRPNADVDPARGSLFVARAAAVRGGNSGSRTEEPSGPGPSEGFVSSGQPMASPGQGLRSAHAGTHRSASARVATARPAVTSGPPTVTALVNGRPKDTVDSDQAVARVLQTQVHASYAGGFVGEGLGGQNGASTVRGAGGDEGRGSVSHALGSGDGDVFDWNTNDPRLLAYFRKIHAKVDPLWRDAFPKSAMLELKQGTVILEFTIAVDGSVNVRWPPVRPSGIEEFDRNCAEAIRRAGPFEPVPVALRSAGRGNLRVRAPFVAKNPIVK